MASGLSRKVESLEKSMALLGMVSDRLRFLQPSMNQLIDGMAALQQFSHIGYLVACRDGMQQGLPFPVSWRQALNKSMPELGKEHREILLPLGEVLGSTDLDSQLAALQNAKLLLENRLEEARAYRERHQKLYQSLGLLTGIAIVILFI